MAQEPDLNRRELLSVAGALGLGATAPIRGSAVAQDLVEPVLQRSCKLTPAIAEGPYYVDTGLVRRDIRERRDGLPTLLIFQVVEAPRCEPVQSAAVDVWHADASGLYSDVAELNTAGQTFMRGVQMTDDAGLVRFVTVYPGYYPGRTPHIHVKVRRPGGGTLTTQTYFPDPISDLVYRAVEPYSSRPARETRNEHDRMYAPQTRMLVLPHPDGTPTLVTGMRLVIP